MNGTIEEWVRKAEGDFAVAQLASRPDLTPNYDAVCYHCQQCVEKLMKAVLIQDGVHPPRTHNLELLHGLLLAARPSFALDVEELFMLSSMGMASRYPGEDADAEDASRAIAICT